MASKMDAMKGRISTGFKNITDTVGAKTRNLKRTKSSSDDPNIFQKIGQRLPFGHKSDDANSNSKHHVDQQGGDKRKSIGNMANSLKSKFRKSSVDKGKADDASAAANSANRFNTNQSHLDEIQGEQHPPSRFM